MKRFIAIVLLVSTSACALRPAPITYLDVGKELSSLKPPVLNEKAAVVTNDIAERKYALKKHIKVDTFFWIFFPLTTSIVWLSFIPARHYTKKEIKLMDEKQEQVNKILGGV